jgi:nucleoside-diphosphate-sugar epimerase
MKVVITGGAGFLGQLLIAEILKRTVLPDAQGSAQEIDGIIALDLLPGRLSDARVHYVIGDVTNPAQLSSLFDATVDGIFHLAAVVSGTAEADFALGMRVNLGGTQAILDACRELPKVPKFLFTSSVAVFGGPLPKVVTDETRTTPQASYGVQKLIAELLVSEYSRKGFVDGRSVRVPTVSVRPGRPNGAASSFASGIIREPLAGVRAICPVEPDTLLWLTSPCQLIASLLHAYELPAAAWSTERSLNLPGITVRVGDMVEALNRIAGPAVAGLVQWQPDLRVSKIVRSWPAYFDTARANAMGFTRDASFASIIQDYIRTYT